MAFSNLVSALKHIDKELMKLYSRSNLPLMMYGIELADYWFNTLLIEKDNQAHKKQTEDGY